MINIPRERFFKFYKNNSDTFKIEYFEKNKADLELKGTFFPKNEYTKFTDDNAVLFTDFDDKQLYINKLRDDGLKVLLDYTNLTDLASDFINTTSTDPSEPPAVGAAPPIPIGKRKLTLKNDKLNMKVKFWYRKGTRLGSSNDNYDWRTGNVIQILNDNITIESDDVDLFPGTGYSTFSNYELNNMNAYIL